MYGMIEYNITKKVVEKYFGIKIDDLRDKIRIEKSDVAAFNTFCYILVKVYNKTLKEVSGNTGKTEMRISQAVSWVCSLDCEIMKDNLILNRIDNCKREVLFLEGTTNLK